MSSIKRDTEQCVYIRFQVNEDRVESFKKMFMNATKVDFLTSLRGLSKESGNMTLTVAFMSPGNTENAKRGFAMTLNTTFVKLFDFYPSISEKPSSLQASAAVAFIQQSLQPAPVSSGTEQKLPAYV